MTGPYTSYRSSGVKWVGEIPEHWRIVNGRRIFTESKTKALPSDAELTASQRHGVIPKTKYLLLEGQKVVEVIKNSSILKHVEPGDFVISMRSFQGGIEFSAFRGCVSSAYIPLRQSASLDLRFYGYLFKSAGYIQALQSTSNLIRDGQALRYANFVLVALPRPPLDEQRQIAEYLDWETGKIDELIAKQEGLIAALAERRNALTADAVTHGLAPEVTSTSSGEWFGHYPSHWKLGRVGNAFRLTLGKMLNASTGTEGYMRPYLRAGNIQENGVDLTEVKLMRFTPEEASSLSLEKGDVVVVEGGGGYGRSDYLAEDLVGWGFQNHVIRARPNAGHYGPFFDFLVKTIRVSGQFEALGSFATIPNVSSDKLARIRYAMPPFTEQVAIAARIQGERAQITRLVDLAGSMIRVLSERRAALISAAVTGKIDVRGL